MDFFWFSDRLEERKLKGKIFICNQEPDTEWYYQYIRNEEVAESMRWMTRNKAVGPDRIAVDILKDTALLVPVITRLFNKIFDSGEIPAEWRTTRVKPLYKDKGCRDETRNYRRISLTPHFYKFPTSILATRVTLQCLPQISLNQQGHRSCEEAI